MSEQDRLEQGTEGTEDEFDAAFAHGDAPGGEPAIPGDGERETHEEIPERENGEEIPEEQGSSEEHSELGGNGSETGEDSDLVALRRKADRADADLGRLRQAQEEIQRLRRELADSRGTSGGQGGRSQEMPASQGVAEIPEDLREDVEAFQRGQPALAPLMLENSPEGERLRKVLEEYGPEHVLTLEVAERVRERRERDAALNARRTEEAEALRRDHYAKIYAAHPDYRELVQGGDALKLRDYHEQLAHWADGKPYGEGRRIHEVLQGGTAEEVVEILKQFKQERKTEPDRKRLRREAEAGMEPPSRPGPLPKGRPSRDDFDAGFDEGLASRRR